MYRLIGSAIAVVGIMIVGAVTSIDRATNYVTTDAEIYRIDRKCMFTVTEKGPNGTKASGEEDDCDSIPEWATRRASHATDKRNLVGTARVKVTYTSPIDQSYQSGVLEFTGRDELFYTLNAHDKLKILVSKSDPTKIKL